MFEGDDDDDDIPPATQTTVSKYERGSANSGNGGVTGSGRPREVKHDNSAGRAEPAPSDDDD